MDSCCAGKYVVLLAEEGIPDEATRCAGMASTLAAGARTCMDLSTSKVRPLWFCKVHFAILCRLVLLQCGSPASGDMAPFACWCPSEFHLESVLRLCMLISDARCALWCRVLQHPAVGAQPLLAWLGGH